MPLNTLPIVQKFTGELDKMIVQKSVTGFMADNVLRSKFVGAKTVIIPDVDFIGLSDYNHDTGFDQSSITVAHTPYTLSQDRARSLQIDREDMDETGIANLAGQIMGEYIRTKVVPEMDAYTLSKLAQIAISKSNTKDIEDVTKVYALFNELANGIYAKTGYDSELVAFVDPVVYAAFMNSTELQRMITVSDFKQGEVNLKVKSINGISLIPTAADRMKSSYTDDTDKGGLKPAEGAKSVGMLILPKKAAHLVKKSEKIRIFEPDTNQKADAYKFDYRLYYDVFVKKSELEHISAALHK